MFDISGKVSVITGAGSGIGLAVAQRYRAAGAEVVLVDYSDAREQASTIGGYFMQADMSCEADVQRIMSDTDSRYGTIDILVLNAGIVGGDDGVEITQCSQESLKQVFEVNCFGVFYGIKHAAQYMKDGGSIIITASQAAIYTAPLTSEYTASKHAAVGLAKSASIELGPLGIRVNAVCPGYTSTPINANTGGITEIVNLTQQIGRVSETEDLVGLYHFLASSESYMMTGQALVVDGGKTAGMTKKFVSVYR